MHTVHGFTASAVSLRVALKHSSLSVLVCACRPFLWMATARCERMLAPGDLPGWRYHEAQIRHSRQPRRLHQVPHLYRPRQHERGVLQPARPEDVRPRPPLAPLQMCYVSRCRVNAVQYRCRDHYCEPLRSNVYHITAEVHSTDILPKQVFRVLRNMHLLPSSRRTSQDARHVRKSLGNKILL